MQDLTTLHFASGAGMIFVAIAVVVGWKVRHRVSWMFFLWGALAWIAGVTLKGIAAIPNEIVIGSVRGFLPNFLAEPLLWIYIGLLTGVFESGAVLGVTLLRRVRAATWQEALGLGLGFGAIEAFILGVVSLLLVLVFVLVPPEEIPPVLQPMAPAEGITGLLTIPAPIVQRVTAILVHGCACLLIIYAVQRRAWSWFWVSFGYKTLVDAIAACFHLTCGLENLTPLEVWGIELVFMPFGVIGAWGIWKFRRKW